VLGVDRRARPADRRAEALRQYSVDVPTDVGALDE
jgi:hypothetical protein